MWKIVFFMYLSGIPTMYETPADFYTRDACMEKASAVIAGLEYTVEADVGLNPKKDFLASTWCIQSYPKETKI